MPRPNETVEVKVRSGKVHEVSKGLLIRTGVGIALLVITALLLLVKHVWLPIMLKEPPEVTMTEVALHGLIIVAAFLMIHPSTGIIMMKYLWGKIMPGGEKDA